MTEATPAGVGGPASVRRPNLLVPSLVFVGLVVAVVSSLGAPLIPTVARIDRVPLSTAQWVLTAALLSGALATPVMGRLADGSRQRAVIAVTLSVVLVGCVLAAVSTSFVVLVVGRGMQGVGMGLLPVNMAIARRNLDRVTTGRAVATLSVSTAIGAGLGYPITSTVAELFGVHAAYWFGAAVVASALAFAVAVLPARSPAAPVRFDIAGAVLLTLAVTGVSVVLSEGGNWGWGSTTTLGLVACCLLVLVVWVPLELRCDHPLVNLHHLSNRSVLMADVSGFLMSMSMYLVVPIVVEFVQIPPSSGFGFGASVIVSGSVLVPLSAGTFLASRLLVPYERRFGARSMIPLGALVFGSAATYFALDHGSLWQAFVTMGIVGLGIGFTFAAMPGFIVRAVPASETGSATGLYQVLRNIGLSFGSALGAAVLLAFTGNGHTYPDVTGFRVALLVSAGLGVLTAVLSFVLPGGTAPPAAARAAGRLDATEVRMEEEALLEAGGAMLSDELDLDDGGRRP
ncbi:MAG: MFS transporter [Acidimicrobiales bacterium]